MSKPGEWTEYESILHFVAMVAFIWVLMSGWGSDARLIIKIVATPPLIFAALMAGRSAFGSRRDFACQCFCGMKLSGPQPYDALRWRSPGCACACHNPFMP